MAKTKLDEAFVAQNVKEIIEELGVSATAEVSRVDNAFFVDISSEDSSLLIGKHGANLESLQFILAIRIKTLSGSNDFELWLDVDGWRQQKEEKLKRMAFSLAEKVATTGAPEAVYNLRPSERRIIHMELSENPSIETVSEGEGLDRHLVIKPKA